MTYHVRSLSKREIQAAFKKTNSLYPYILPLSLWRAWELGAYRHYRLRESVLDLGCGDGHFFNLCFPRVRQAVGVDISPRAVELSRQSGIYKNVYETPADQLPFEDYSFETVFSNCAMEHMDNIDGVFSEMYRVLKRRGNALFSVVTENMVNFSPLKQFLVLIGAHQQADDIQKQYEEYHHLVNPFSIEKWIQHITQSGLVVEEYVPLLPPPHGTAFLLFDELWHIPHDQFEFGNNIHANLRNLPNFDKGISKIMDGLLEMTSSPNDAAGVVFYVRKP